MKGMQQTVYDGLQRLATSVREGVYGKDDEAFQDDEIRDQFDDDLQDEVIDKTC